MKEIPTEREQAIRADGIIKVHTGWAAGAGLIPFIGADLLAVTALQLDMIRQLAKLYNVDFEATKGKATISALAGSGFSKMGARALIKLIPGIGSIIGGVAMATLSGASTYALGEVFKRHFAAGGTFLDFDTERVRKQYAEKFEKGKKVVEEVRKEQSPVEKTTEGTTPKIADLEVKRHEEVMQRLRSIKELHTDGILSDEEFAILKQKLIDIL